MTQLPCKHCDSNLWELSKNECGTLFIKCSNCGYVLAVKNFSTDVIIGLLEGKGQ